MTDCAPYVKQLLNLPENEFCADCQKPHPTWASTTFGVFICINCSGIHRNLGTHITLVRSVTLDTWTTKQYKVMKKVGNLRANEYYEAKLKGTNGRPSSTDRQSMERFIYEKYVLKLFAADGQPPHITLLMPNTHQDSGIHRLNHNFLKNENEDEKEIDPLIKHDKNIDYTHEIQKNSIQTLLNVIEAKFPTNEISNSAPNNEMTKQRSYSTKVKSSNNSIDPFLSHKQNHFKSSNKSDDSSFSLKFAKPLHSDRINENYQTEDINNTKSIPETKKSQKSNIEHLLGAVGIQKEFEAKKSENNSDDIIEFTLENENDDQMITKSGNENLNNCEENFTEESSKKVLPKFAKKLDSELENDQSSETITQDNNQKYSHLHSTDVFDVLNHIKDKKSHSNPQTTKTKNKAEEELIFINPGVEEEPEQTQVYSQTEPEIKIPQQLELSREKTKSLPKFAKLKDEDTTDNISLEENQQSSEIFDKLNQIKDKKTQPTPKATTTTTSTNIDNNKDKNKKKTKEDEEELIFINPGVEEEPEQTQVYSQTEPEIKIQQQLELPHEKTKSLPKFAKLKDEDTTDNISLEENQQSSEIFDKLNQIKNKKDQPTTTTNINKNKDKDKKKTKEEEEELIFINPGVEEEPEQTEPEIKIPQQLELSREKTKSLPKFAKLKDEDTTDNISLEENQQSSEIFDKLNQIKDKKTQPATKTTTTTTTNINKNKDKNKKKTKEEEEELIFINPGVEEEPEQTQVYSQTEPEIKIPQQLELSREKTKSLPKFAKLKDEETPDNISLEENQQSSEIFDKLNQIKNKKDQPTTLKTTTSTNINKNKDKNKKKTKEEEEELIFINPGVEEEPEKIQSEIRQNEIKPTENIVVQKEKTESNKSLPKFAKKKTDLEDQNQNENNEIFSSLNQLNNKIEPQPILLKNINKSNNTQKKNDKNKESNEEELIFINPIANDFNQAEFKIQNLIDPSLLNNNNVDESNTQEQIKKKALPKFAKKKDENETDKEIHVLNNNNIFNDQNKENNNDLLFEVLKHLK